MIIIICFVSVVASVKVKILPINTGDEMLRDSRFYRPTLSMCILVLNPFIGVFSFSRDFLVFDNSYILLSLVDNSVDVFFFNTCFGFLAKWFRANIRQKNLPSRWVLCSSLHWLPSAVAPIERSSEGTPRTRQTGTRSPVKPALFRLHFRRKK